MACQDSWIFIGSKADTVQIGFRLLRSKLPKDMVKVIGKRSDHRWQYFLFLRRGVSVYCSRVKTNTDWLEGGRGLSCCKNIIRLMACGVTTAQTSRLASLQSVTHTSRPHSRCGFSGVNVAPYMTQVPVQIRPEPRHPGKTDEFRCGPGQAARWLTLGIKTFKSQTLRELCMHSSKTSKSVYPLSFNFCSDH